MHLKPDLDSGRAGMLLEGMLCITTSPTASKVNLCCRSSWATNNHTSRPMLWDHIKHHKLLEISHGHHVIPQEFHYDLPLINIHCLYFKVLLLCHTTGCYTNHKCYQYSCIYLNSNWLKCDLSHNTFLLWYVTQIADLTLLLSQVVTLSIILNNCRA